MNAQAYVAIMALCPDRPGLVAAVSEFLRERGANIEDSRMAVLGDQFGIMLLASGRDPDISRIEAEIPALRDVGFDLIVRRTPSPAERKLSAMIPCVVTADAIDHEGIVHAVSLAIHELGVNIVSMQANAYPAPVSGSPLFRLEARIEIPPGRSVDQVLAALNSVAERERLDIQLREL